MQIRDKYTYYVYICLYIYIYIYIYIHMCVWAVLICVLCVRVRVQACPGYNDKRMHRKVASDVAEFASDFEAKLKGAAEGFTKQVRLVEAPAAEMALDALILETADNACCRDLQFLSREDMGKRPETVSV